jgi:hypothetical protein
VHGFAWAHAIAGMTGTTGGQVTRNLDWRRWRGEYPDGSRRRRDRGVRWALAPWGPGAGSGSDAGNPGPGLTGLVVCRGRGGLLRKKKDMTVALILLASFFLKKQ